MVEVDEVVGGISEERLPAVGARPARGRIGGRALAYNLAKFMRTLALPQEVEQWSLTAAAALRNAERPDAASVLNFNIRSGTVRRHALCTHGNYQKLVKLCKYNIGVP